MRKMIVHDKGLSQVFGDRTYPEDPATVGVSPARIAEYRRLLKELGIEGGILAPTDKKSVELMSSTRGFVTHGSRKGYLYTEEKVDEVVADLDQVSASGVGSGLRRIEGNWYLLFEGD